MAYILPLRPTAAEPNLATANRTRAGLARSLGVYELSGYEKLYLTHAVSSSLSPKYEPGIMERAAHLAPEK